MNNEDLIINDPDKYVLNEILKWRKILKKQKDQKNSTGQTEAIIEDKTGSSNNN